MTWISCITTTHGMTYNPYIHFLNTACIHPRCSAWTRPPSGAITRLDSNRMANHAQPVPCTL